MEKSSTTQDHPHEEQDDTAETSDNRKRQRRENKRRFECTFAGCGRTYSRAEHLYRHQLNHNPKEIFKCNHRGCARTFVRQDLCIRHQERHSQHDQPGSENNVHGASTLSSSPSPELGEGSSNGIKYPKTYNTENSTSAAKPSSNANVQNYASNHRKFDNDRSNVSATDFAALYGSSASYTETNTSFNKQTDRLAKSRSEYGLLDSISNTNVRPPTQNSPAGIFPSSGFGDNSFSESPASVRDEFTSWLFDDFTAMPNTQFPIAAQTVTGFGNSADIFGNQFLSNYFADPMLNNLTPGPFQQQRSVELETPAQDLAVSSNILSLHKRQALLELMEFRFSDGDGSVIGNIREAIFQGDIDADDHVLSMRSMQHYIGSYWFHFNAQLPMLHQPTFSAEETHNYLLLAIISIGASCLNKAHGRAVTDDASKLATYIAWHLRWLVFMDTDFRPPAKLWVFQTLLLLEVYEKMNATRALHERAHIHYPTTIMLMRRGTALTDDPQHEFLQKPSTPEQWWSRWITAEATRRAAFVAFFIDALHAIMFGHAAMMVVHEVRLPLPCDEALWSATSAAELGRVAASLHANGIRPTLFLDGLKKVLTGRKVRTNAFGRLILMSGLLSVSWHMHQRDLQISSLSVSNIMGIPGSWKESLSKAFDFWKKDFDDSAAHMRRATLPWQGVDTTIDNREPSIMASVLHHLSHIAMNIDIMDCQIYAGAKRVFGRTITDTDYERAKSKMYGWTNTSGSRMAVFHALQILREVLLPTADRPVPIYSARDDHLFIRPWAIYYAVLVVWAWGFAVDGVLRPFPSHLLGVSALNTVSPDSGFHDFNQGANLKDAQTFLRTIGAVRTPHDLETIKTGRNNVVGLLSILRVAFADSRWELLQEAAVRLENATRMLER